LEREFFLSLSLIFCPLRMMKSIKIVFICWPRPSWRKKNRL
jgi:hypothetical protein